MSHFYALIFIDPETLIGRSRESFETKVQEMIAPYDESIEVEEYEAKCYCIGRAAKNAAWKHAEKKVGTIESFRQRYHAIPEASRPPWDDFLKPFNDAKKQKMTIHPRIKNFGILNILKSSATYTNTRSC